MKLERTIIIFKEFVFFFQMNLQMKYIFDKCWPHSIKRFTLNGSFLKSIADRQLIIGVNCRAVVKKN